MQEPPVPLKSIPRMAHHPFLCTLLVKAVPGQPAARRGKINRTLMEEGSNNEPSVKHHDCMVKEQEETKSCCTWRKKLGLGFLPRLLTTQLSLKKPCLIRKMGPVFITKCCVHCQTRHSYEGLFVLQSPARDLTKHVSGC